MNELAKAFPETPVLKLDSGNFSDNPTPEGDIKTQALLEAMQRLGYRVVNVGERDVRMGYTEFERRTHGSPFRFVSANIVRQDTQEPIFDPHVVVEAVSPDGKHKRRVGVVGAVRFNPLFLKAGPEKTNMVIVQPIERVEREVKALQEEGVDVIVLLAALHKEDAKRIVEQVPQIDYVMGSYGGSYTLSPEQVGETSLLYCGNRGQRVVETRVFLDQPRKNLSRVHMLSRDYPFDQEMLDFVNSIKLAPPGAEGVTDHGALSPPRGPRADS